MLADHLRDVFDAMPDAVFVADPATLQIAYANASALALTGQTLPQLHDLTLHDITPLLTPSLLAHPLVRQESSDGHLTYQTDLQPPAGTPIPVELRVHSTILDGTPYVIGTARDIRREQEAKQALRESEWLYRSLVEATSDLIFRIARDGTYRDFRVPPESGLPVPPAEAIIGRNVTEVVPGHVAQVALPAIQRTLDTGHPQTIEYTIQEPDYAHHYEARFVPAGPDEIVAVVRDVTARKNEADRLKISEATYRALLNASADAALLTDRNWAVLVANDAMIERLGRPVNQIIGAVVFDLLPPEVAERRRLFGDLVTQSKRPVSFEDERAGRIIASRVHPLLDENGEIVQYAVFARDITDQRRAEQRLERQRLLLKAVAEASNLLLASGDLETTIEQTLHILGPATGADLVAISVNHQHTASSELLISPYTYWASSPLPAGARPLSDWNNLPWPQEQQRTIYETLQQRQALVIHKDTAAPQSHDPLEAIGIQFVLLVPIFVDLEFWGVLSFSHLQTDYEWSPEEINALQTMASSLGSAIQRQRDQQELQQKRAFAERLRQFTNTITTIFNPEMILQQLLEEAQRLVPCRAGTGLILDGDTARAVAFIGYEHFGIWRHTLVRTTYPLQHMPILEHIARTGEAYLIRDTREEPDWVKVPGDDWIRSWLGTPIVSRGKTCAIITLDAAEPGYFTPQHQHWVEQLAQQAAIALENAWYVADVQRLEQIKSEMIRLASHDLRSPLTRVYLTAQRLHDELHNLITPAQHQQFEQVLAATQEIDYIISNILSLEHIEAQYRAAQPIYWCELIEQSVQALHPELEQAGLTLHVDCPQTLPVTRGNPLKLERAIYNLLHNAIKYTPSGGTIQVRAYEKPYGPERVLAVEIQDSGIGIPPDQLGNLFQPFFRVPNAQTAQIAGMGLGLSMVKTIIQEHHGQVYVDSTAGAGSLFGFWVPIPEGN